MRHVNTLTDMRQPHFSGIRTDPRTQVNGLAPTDMVKAYRHIRLSSGRLFAYVSCGQQRGQVWPDGARYEGKMIRFPIDSRIQSGIIHVL